ncbi:hypothetical protein MRB53_027757 [Persea americana]|uniref:Uncharacterized protein n=1 Tax=Persea americana TaxID=3435 RepID=A0ACC2LLT2_PERAE|nr:hypothetical protein MRB53_027757 [Persea americana]
MASSVPSISRSRTAIAAVGKALNTVYKVHAHIVKLTKRDRALPQFHYVIISWELNNGCGKPGFYYPMIELEKTDLGTLVNSQIMCSGCLQ